MAEQDTLTSTISASSSFTSVKGLFVTLDASASTQSAFTAVIGKTELIASAITVSSPFVADLIYKAVIRSAILASGSFAAAASRTAVFFSQSLVSSYFEYADSSVTWRMLLDNGATSRYTNFPDANIFNVSGDFYALSADGIYRFAGVDDTTDDGGEIEAVVDFGVLADRSSDRKSLRAVYLSVMDSEAYPLVVTVSDGVRSYDYASGKPSADEVVRVVPGKGMIGTHLSFKLRNSGGGAFTLTQLFALVDKARRKVRHV